MAWNLKHVPMFAKEEIIEMIEGKDPSDRFVDAVHKYKKEIEKEWPKEIKELVFKKVF